MSFIQRLIVAASLSMAVCVAHADIVYSSTPAVLPPNLPSLGYQATSTREFGDHVQFAAGGRALQSVTVTMSDWALASTYNSSAAGYFQNLTFNIYNFVNNTAAGSLIATRTINAFVPWRPEASASCSNNQYLASDGSCNSGIAFNVNFDFSALGIVLPNDVVFGLAFDTQSYGANPTGVDGPYNSLNFALSPSATIGTDVNPDGTFWNTGYQPFLTSGTAGTFGQDTGWAGFVPAVQFITAAAVPEPSSIALFGIALAGLAAVGGRRRSR